MKFGLFIITSLTFFINLSGQVFEKKAKLGCEFIKTEDFDSAIVYLEEAFKLKEHSRVAFYLGYCYYEKNRPSSAKYYLEKVKKLEPELETKFYRKTEKFLADIKTYEITRTIKLPYAKTKFVNMWKYKVKKKDMNYFIEDHDSINMTLPVVRSECLSKNDSIVQKDEINIDDTTVIRNIESIGTHDYKFVYFTTVWSGPSRNFTPILIELRNEYSADIDFIQVDSDREPEHCMKYNVQRIPTTIILYEDNVIWRLEGVSSKYHYKMAIDERSKLKAKSNYINLIKSRNNNIGKFIFCEIPNQEGQKYILHTVEPKCIIGIENECSSSTLSTSQDLSATFKIECPNGSVEKLKIYIYSVFELDQLLNKESNKVFYDTLIKEFFTILKEEFSNTLEEAYLWYIENAESNCECNKN
jgi:thiol-disulfide isomerase/thioredoxin